VLAALIFSAIMAGMIERHPFNAEVTLGVTLGIPAVYLLTRFKYHRIDELLGNISYGVFLNHYVVMYFLHALWPADYDASRVATVLALAFVLSAMSYYCVELPALVLRHRFRAGERFGVASARVGEAAI
jgi:peptidoglycan/LPS O-acetylase OafA/YrhL